MITKKQLKEMLTTDIMRYIIDRHKLNDTRKYAKERCLFYFPLANINLQNATINFAEAMQEIYYCKESFDDDVKKYKIRSDNNVKIL